MILFVVWKYLESDASGLKTWTRLWLEPYGPTEVKFRLLISSISVAMNFQHFLEMLEIMLQHYQKMLEIKSRHLT